MDRQIFEPRRHFLALDSWRGICACLVVFLHVPAYSHAYFTPLTRNAGLFVDFFFVLSGFVIAANYYSRFEKGYSVSKFMFLRLGRLYPIHLLMLAAYIAFEFAFADMIAQVNANGRQPFSGAMSTEAIWVNLAMLQGVGYLDHPSWNFPSWSISTELFAYLSFALGVIYIRRLFPFVMGALILLCPVWIYLMADGVLDNRFMGLARCLVGFSAGVLCLQLYRHYEQAMQQCHWMLATLAEVLVVALVIGYLYLPDNATTYALPVPIFFAAVFVFAHQGGLLSRGLMVKPLIFVGTLSFSIYMIHAFVTARIVNAIQLVAGKMDFALFTYITEEGKEVRMIGTELWHGDMLYAFMIGFVIALSYLTYRFIEAPARDAFRNVANRVWPGRLTASDVANDYKKKEPVVLTTG